MKAFLKYYKQNIVLTLSALTVVFVYSLTWELFYAVRHQGIVALTLQGILILMWWGLSNFSNFYVFYTLIELPDQILLKISVLLLFLLYPFEFLLFSTYAEWINIYTVYLAIFCPFLIGTGVIYKVIKVKTNLRSNLEKRQGLYVSSLLSGIYMLLSLLLSSGWRMQNEKLSVYLTTNTLLILTIMLFALLLLLKILAEPFFNSEINGVPILRSYPFQFSIQHSNASEDVNHSPSKNDEGSSTTNEFVFSSDRKSH